MPPHKSKSNTTPHKSITNDGTGNSNNNIPVDAKYTPSYRIIDEKHITFRKRKKVGDSSHCEKEEQQSKQKESILTNVKEGETVEIIGDSILNNINARNISKKGNVKVLNHSGAISKDLKSHIIPTINRKPNVLIIHIGTNDLVNQEDTIANLETTVNRVKRKSAHINIVMSSLLIRKDKLGIDKEVLTLNEKIKMFCNDNLVKYLSNDSINGSCLGRGKLHPNQKRKAMLVKNFINCIEKMV